MYHYREKNWPPSPLVGPSLFPLEKHHLKSQLRHEIFPLSVNGMINNSVFSIVQVLLPALCDLLLVGMLVPSHTAVLGMVQPDSWQRFHIIFSELLNLQFLPSRFTHFTLSPPPHFILAGCKLQVSWGNRVSTINTSLSYIWLFPACGPI